MIIKYIGEVDFDSKGVNFIKGFDYEVSEEVANYLKENFKERFEFTEVTKAKETSKKAVVNEEVVIEK